MNEQAFWIVVAMAFPFVGVAFLTAIDWVIHLIFRVKEWYNFYESFHDIIYENENGIVIRTEAYKKKYGI